MRYFVCVIFLVLCLVVWECTAEAEGTEGQFDQRGGSVLTPTAAPKQGSPGPLNQSDDRKDKDGAQAGRGQEDGSQKEQHTDDDNDEDAEGDGKVTEGDSRTGLQERSLSGVDPLQAVVQTTTTTENKKQTDGQGTLTAGAQSSLTQGHDPTKTDLAGTNSGTQDQTLPSSGSQLQVSPPQKVNNTNLSVPVPLSQSPTKIQDSEGNERTVSEPQGTALGQTGASSTSASSKVIGGAPHKEIQPKTEPKRKGEDQSNGDREGTVQGRVNPQQVAAATTTTSTEKKTSPQLPDTKTDDVLTPQLQGQSSSKTSTGLQNPVTPIKPADPTESQKQIGAKATTTKTTTTKPATVNTESGAALTNATITTDKQTASTETSTTSTVAPNNTLTKGFKIPQSLDKMDGSYSSSLLFAFATIVTFIVIAVTPVY